MPENGSRRRFIAGLASAVVVYGRSAWGQAPSSPPAAPPDRMSSPLHEGLVHEWVWRGHFDPEGIARMLGERPTLLNAAFDWGNGDYETAIGAAGHMGRRDIAEFLLQNGARMDLFVAAMLGRLDIVRATLTAYPPLAASKGPHGIPLLVHAQKGGERSRPVVEYLQSLGTP